MRRVLKPLLLPLLRRDPGEVDRQARHFRVESAEGLALVSSVGRSFLGGYNAMLAAAGFADVVDAGARVEPHFRPFFFEGAAMGYLPRGAFTPGLGPGRAEADLLAMDPRFRYLYYVGLGFWYGFRHPRRPAALESLSPHLDPMYAPLCYDGYGFKVGFFDYPTRTSARDLLERAPADRRPFLYQGFGRALFFVCMEDETRFERERAAVPAERRGDLEFGRSLALAFTGLRTPERILRHLEAPLPEDERRARLLGVTWALTAREMNDRDHFERCLAGVPEGDRDRLARLPVLCREALGRSGSYDAWRLNTLDAAIAVFPGPTEARR